MVADADGEIVRTAGEVSVGWFGVTDSLVGFTGVAVFFCPSDEAQPAWNAITSSKIKCKDSLKKVFIEVTESTG